ncbi:MAG: class I SAM-dependent methyltransferase, partial [Candidatus Bruticola sp.]
MTNDCPLKRLTNHWNRWWSIRPLFKSSLLVRRIVGEEDTRINAVNLLELKPGQRVLDLSCGLGANLRYLHASGAEIVAVDENPENVEAARTEIRANHFMNIKAMSLQDAEKTLEEGSFDAILCTGTFTSSSYPYKALYNACRWLKTGGLIAAADYINNGRVEEQLLFAPFILSTYMLANSSPNNAWPLGLASFCDILFCEEMQSSMVKLVLARKRSNGTVAPPPKRVEIPVCKPRQSRPYTCPNISGAVSSVLNDARQAIKEWQDRQRQAYLKAAEEKKRAEALIKAKRAKAQAKAEAEAKAKAAAEEEEARIRAEAEAKAKAAAEEEEARIRAEAEAKAKAAAEEEEARIRAEAEAKAKAAAEEEEARIRAEAEAKAKAAAEEEEARI